METPSVAVLNQTHRATIDRGVDVMLVAASVSDSVSCPHAARRLPLRSAQLSSQLQRAACLDTHISNTALLRLSALHDMNRQQLSASVAEAALCSSAATAAEANRWCQQSTVSLPLDSRHA